MQILVCCVMMPIDDDEGEEESGGGMEWIICVHKLLFSLFFSSSDGKEKRTQHTQVELKKLEIFYAEFKKKERGGSNKKF